MPFAGGRPGRWTALLVRLGCKPVTAGFPNGRTLAWGVPIVVEAAALGRSVVFAWAIGADELGRAMMLALAVRLVEMATDLGTERMIVQARDGDTMRLQASLHAVAILRGGICSLLILALAPVLAWSFADGPNASSYSLLAVIPLLDGLRHSDFRRLERQFRYGLMASVEAGATLAMLFALVPAIVALGDHRAMAVALVSQAAARTALSHLVAERSYVVRFCGETLARSWRFGTPLILNAALLFLTFYADRLIVAHSYDWAALALYGVALQLAMLPAQIVGRAAGSLMMPKLRASLDQGRLASVWPGVVAVHWGMATVMVVGFAVLAPSVISIFFGDALRPGFWLALALGVASAGRILRTPYSQLAIAVGRTGDPARANLVRGLAVVLAGGFAMAGLPLESIAMAAALGELGATLRAVHLAGLHRPVSKGVLA